MSLHRMKSAEQALADLEQQGVSVAEWARQHGFSLSTVNNVLKGKTAGRFGVGHRIKVALGMKPPYLKQPAPLHGAVPAAQRSA